MRQADLRSVEVLAKVACLTDVLQNVAGEQLAVLGQVGASRIANAVAPVVFGRRGREPFLQETLPHPSINLVIEPDGAWI